MFWKKKKPQKTTNGLTRDQILAQAKANASAAREEIGDETLEKIKAALAKKENSPLMQAKNKVKAMDDNKVRDNLSLWLKEDKEH
ncbi:MAG: hypothetical protein GW903_05740 [Alphaproteobacteria bacterium]|nr:hypothetical protein [Alphaproteobacteria bacterium]NCQ88382.1 hypothetical protein [Alphaproteobacteria bacterium]NCT05924.1 hypothetical protein [Alphaproteobacteria bacterium]